MATKQLWKIVLVYIILVLTPLTAQDEDGTHFYWISDKTGTDDGYLKKYGPDSRNECNHYLARIDGISVQRGAAVALGSAKRNNTANWQGFVDFVTNVNPDIVLGMNSGLMNKSWEFASRDEWKKNWNGDIELISVAQAAGVKKVVMFMQSPLSKGQNKTFDPNIIDDSQPNGGATLDMRIADCVEYADFVEANKPSGVEVTYGLIDAFPAKNNLPKDAYHKAYVDLAVAFMNKGYLLEEIQVDMKTKTVSAGANSLLYACERAYNEVFQATGNRIRMSWYTWWGFNDDPTILQVNSGVKNAFVNIAEHSKAKYMTGLLLDGNYEDRSGITDLIPTNPSDQLTITARLNQAFSILENLNTMNPTQKGDPILGSNNGGGVITIPKPKPDEVSILNRGTDKLQINWVDNISSENGFVIQRYSDKNPEWINIDTTEANTTTFTDTALTPFEMYYYRLRAIYDGDTLSGATEPIPGRPSNTRQNTLPDGWKAHSFGEESVAMASGSFEKEDTFFIDAGDGDFWAETDRGHMIYKQASGDGAIIAKLENYDHVQGFSMAGVMIRESLEDGSKFATMMMMSDPGPIVRDRIATSGAVNQKPYNKTGEKAPYWVKLERNGNTFSGSISPDGINYTLIRTVNVSMNKTIYVGLAATSHNNLASGIYSFSNVQLNFATPISENFTRNTFKVFHQSNSQQLIIKELPSTTNILSIYDISGKQFERIITSQKQFSIPTKGLKPGVYILKVNNLHFNRCTKFIIH